MNVALKLSPGGSFPIGWVQIFVVTDLAPTDVQRWAVDPAVKDLTISELALKICEGEATKYDGPTPCMEHQFVAECLLAALNSN